MGRYSNIPIIKNINNTPFQSMVRYPEIPFDEDDIYLLTEFGDRLDILSFQFYNRTDLYWIIIRANPNEIKGDSLFLNSGLQIRVPIKIDQIINDYNQLNNI